MEGIHDLVVNYRDNKLDEVLKKLGFTFNTFEEKVRFGNARLLSISHEDTPETAMVYLDYGTPNQKLLAEMHDPEITPEGKVKMKDIYY